MARLNLSACTGECFQRIFCPGDRTADTAFAQLSALTAKPSKSLHRMLSPTGKPSMDNLAAIFHAIRARLNVSLEAHSVAA